MSALDDREDDPPMAPPPTRPENDAPPFPPPPGLPSSFAPPAGAATTQPAPDALANAILEKLQPSFDNIWRELTEQRKLLVTVEVGVRMSLAGQDSLASTLGGHGQQLKTIANGVSTISARMTSLEQGVAAQVHHEVVKALDANRSVQDLGALEAQVEP